MPVRPRLQRPFSRSVAPAAHASPLASSTSPSSSPWPPSSGPASRHFRPLHGSRQPQAQAPPPSPSALNPKLSERLSALSSSAQSQSRPGGKKSLFEHLFPNEARARPTQGATHPSDASSTSQASASSIWLSHLSVSGVEPPAEPLHLDAEQLPSNVSTDIASALRDPNTTSSSPADIESLANRVRGMLIISGLSTQLVESDFLRLGVPGRHVQGWVSGILRVVQARDYATLAPLGRYYVLFDSHAAAAAYRARALHLWALAKTHQPGAHHSKRSRRRGFQAATLQPPDMVPDDVAAALRAFTLLVPGQRHSVSPPRGPGGLDAILNRDASLLDSLSRHAGSSHLVLVAVEDGRLALDTFRAAVHADGLRRNLPWRVVGGTREDQFYSNQARWLDAAEGHSRNREPKSPDGRSATGRGIIPFGKSTLKEHEDGSEMADDSDAGSPMSPADEESASMTTGGSRRGRRGAGMSSSARTVGCGPRSANDDAWYRHRRFPRFIVAFTDAVEARRFARHWHRRTLALQMGESAAGQAEMDAGGGPREETRLLKVELMW